MFETSERLPDKFNILVHKPSLEVGCVLLQAAHGCPTVLSKEIGSDHWFISPKEGMEVMSLTKDEIPKFKELFKIKEKAIEKGVLDKFLEQWNSK